MACVCKLLHDNLSRFLCCLYKSGKVEDLHLHLNLILLLKYFEFSKIKKAMIPPAN